MLEIATALVFAQAVAAQAAAPARCDGEAFHTFDFWVGDWDVYPRASGKLVAHSKIERLYASCGIRENWMPLGGTGGGSLSSVDPISGRWHQTWVGSAPGRVEFEGGAVGRGMVLSGYWRGIGGPGKDGLMRMTYTPEEGGALRQHGEVSYDYGVTWADSFDFLYRRAAAAH